ncbi:hypothetical protein KIL84_016119 [Mauremys mutica]|uniref:Uncharacterized protein n=1 Tax=Mauremys mutica TaxID=74926 RepID=A0A9D4AMG6_9SAUR|nr:hypothetical protein KIL84_016119 [Mauremys mutica]
MAGENQQQRQKVGSFEGTRRPAASQHRAQSNTLNPGGQVQGWAWLPAWALQRGQGRAGQPAWGTAASSGTAPALARGQRPSGRPGRANPSSSFRTGPALLTPVGFSPAEGPEFLPLPHPLVTQPGSSCPLPSTGHTCPCHFLSTATGPPEVRGPGQ